MNDINNIHTKSSDFRVQQEHFTPTKSFWIFLKALTRTHTLLLTHTAALLHALNVRRDCSFILFDFIFVLAICPGA